MYQDWKIIVVFVLFNKSYISDNNSMKIPILGLKCIKIWYDLVWCMQYITWKKSCLTYIMRTFSHRSSILLSSTLVILSFSRFLGSLCFKIIAILRILPNWFEFHQISKNWRNTMTEYVSSYQRRSVLKYLLGWLSTSAGSEKNSR